MKSVNRRRVNMREIEREMDRQRNIWSGPSGDMKPRRIRQSRKGRGLEVDNRFEAADISVSVGTWKDSSPDGPR